MRKSYIFSIICLLLLSANQVVALSYKDEFPKNSINNPLTKANISEAKLLQSYVISYREKISSLYDSYTNKKSQVMLDANSILANMSSSLQNIQDSKISSQDATDIMKSIVSDLKTLNTRMKVYLQQEEIIFKNRIAKEKEKYVITWKRISSILDKIISQFTNSLSKKESLSESEKNIIRSLLRLSEENSKIKKFESISFTNEDQMKIYFKNIIVNIRKEILIIKELS